jgi:hypothetical protein
MTNIQKFFTSSPGVIFIFVFSLSMMTTAETRVMIGAVYNDFSTDREQLLSFTALVVVFLAFASAALTLVIGRVWDALFYFFGGGYDRAEYEPIRDLLRTDLAEGSISRHLVNNSRIQPLYGTILHSFAPTSYIEWLGRRWTSFNNAGLQATGSVLAVLSANVWCWQAAMMQPSWLTSLIFGLIFPGITMLIGRARLFEVLASERLFCLSIADDQLRATMNAIAKSIVDRGGSQGGVPDLDPLL